MSDPRDALPPDVLDALRRGDAIDAIKRLRASRGLGLKDAKDRIDVHARGFAPGPTPPDHTRALPPDAARALARGDKIEAIKLARHEAGLGLKEARDWVEAHASPTRPPTGLSPGEVPRREGALGWIALFVAVMVAGWFFLR